MRVCRSRKKPNFCVVLHFVIIQRTISTSCDYKICTPFLSRCFLAGEFELFTRPAKSDFLQIHQGLDDLIFVCSSGQPWKIIVYLSKFVNLDFLFLTV